VAERGQSWLDRAGNHASSQLTVTEPFTLRGPNHIWYEATLDAPTTFTRPWTIEMHKCVPFADRLLCQDLLPTDR
jgi:hypothetical protein